MDIASTNTQGGLCNNDSLLRNNSTFDVATITALLGVLTNVVFVLTRPLTPCSKKRIFACVE